MLQLQSEKKSASFEDPSNFCFLPLSFGERMIKIVYFETFTPKSPTRKVKKSTFSKPLKRQQQT